MSFVDTVINRTATGILLTGLEPCNDCGYQNERIFTKNILMTMLLPVIISQERLSRLDNRGMHGRGYT